MLFFHEEIPAGSWKLNEDESRHIKVLRMRVGDTFFVTDGKGNLATVELEKTDKQCLVRTVSAELKVNHTPNIHLYVAPTKNSDRTEWLVEKVVEMGVRSVHFLQCKNSERVHLKAERILRVAVAAMKQSVQYHLPEFHFDVPFVEAWKNATALKCLAHCANGEKHKLSHIPTTENELSLFIGPEGDFAQEEISFAQDGLALSLGDTRLRTETAAMKVVVQAHTYFEYK
ncbi:MAG: RsmE family RNA methyltransferase [Bacteroidota bacterium]